MQTGELQAIPAGGTSPGQLCRVELLSLLEKQRTLTEHLLERIVDYENLNRAYKQVASNDGSGGVDGMETEALRQWLGKHINSLQKELLTEKYEVSPVRKKEIPKPQGGTRMLGIPKLLSYYFITVSCRNRFSFQIYGRISYCDLNDEDINRTGRLLGFPQPAVCLTRVIHHLSELKLPGRIDFDQDAIFSPSDLYIFLFYPVIDHVFGNAEHLPDFRNGKLILRPYKRFVNLVFVPDPFDHNLGKRLSSCA
jgi:hypothetical protein